MLGSVHSRAQCNQSVPDKLLSCEIMKRGKNEKLFRGFNKNLTSHTDIHVVGL